MFRQTNFQECNYFIVSFTKYLAKSIFVSLKKLKSIMDIQKWNDFRLSMSNLDWYLKTVDKANRLYQLCWIFKFVNFFKNFCIVSQDVHFFLVINSLRVSACLMFFTCLTDDLWTRKEFLRRPRPKEKLRKASLDNSHIAVSANFPFTLEDNVSLQSIIIK